MSATDDTQPQEESAASIEAALARPSDKPAATPMLLEYESTRDRLVRTPPVDVFGIVFAFATGFGAASIALMIITGAVSPLHFTPPFEESPHYLAIGVYAVLELMVVGLLVAIIQRPGWRIVERWVVLGALLGAGAWLLLGGIYLMGRE